MKKILIIIVLTLGLVGCRNKTLDKNYNKMQLKEDGLDSYQADIRIYGKYKNNRVNEYLKVSNYKNEQIIIYNSKVSIFGKNYVIYDNGKTYSVSSNNKITIVSDNKYADTAIYLEGLKNFQKVTKEKDEVIAKKTYSVYSAKVKKKIFESILMDTVIEDLKLEENVPAKIWIDKDGYVYRIIYYLDEAIEGDGSPLEISLRYYDYNNVQKKNFDPNAKPEEKTEEKFSGGLFKWQR